MSKSKIYVDLPSLFDLRHSALYHMLGQSQAEEIVMREPYNLRETDLIPDIDQALFDSYLASTDLRLLDTAPMTYIQVTISSKIQNLEHRNAFMAEHSDPELVVNVFPFELTLTQSEVLQNLIFVKIGKPCTVTIVHEHPKGLSPHYLKNTGFIACFMYDFTQWGSFHAKAVESGDLKEVMMYFPAISKVMPDKEEIKAFTKLGFKDGFSYAEYLFTGRMQLNFLPTFFYSSLITATAFLELHKEDLIPFAPHLPKDQS